MGTEVTPAALQSIAGRLSGAENRPEGFKSGATPKAGSCTGLLAATMGTYTDTLADLVDALANSATKVRDSHDSFVETEQRNRRGLHQSGGH